jgi:hypothetical protein
VPLLTTAKAESLKSSRVVQCAAWKRDLEIRPGGT